MPWLKLLHITAVIVWCGALLYLPLAIANARAGTAALAARGVVRGLFTHLATPAALVAIASGTAIFVLQGPLELWLLAKLVVVALLVLGHGLCGVLILRSERQLEALAVQGESPWAKSCIACGLLLVASLAWLGGIAWLVLQKPF
jgi:uncharacterized membrane protein